MLTFSKFYPKIDSFAPLLLNIRFVSKLYRQNVRIPMGTNCASSFFYERDTKFLTKEKRFDMTDALYLTSRYSDDLLVGNIHFEQMFHRKYPAEPQLN